MTTPIAAVSWGRGASNVFPLTSTLASTTLVERDFEACFEHTNIRLGHSAATFPTVVDDREGQAFGLAGARDKLSLYLPGYSVELATEPQHGVSHEAVLCLI